MAPIARAPGPSCASLAAVRRGLVYMMLSTLAFTVMVALVKIAREQLTALEVLCWRGTTSVVLTFVLAARVGFGVRQPGLMFWRVALGFGAMFCYFTAAKGLTLADMAIVGKLQPIWVALLAPLMLGASERGGWLLAVSVVLGLLGTGVLLAPELTVGSKFGVYALAGTVLSAGAHIAVRALRTAHRPETIVFWFQLGAATLAAMLLWVTEGRVPLPPSELWPHLLGCGVAATAGQLLMTRAYAVAKAPLAAAASYVGPIWGIAGDLMIYGVWPDLSGWLGGALVVASGAVLFTTRGEESDTPAPPRGPGSPPARGRA